MAPVLIAALALLAPSPDVPQTRAERTDFAETSTHADVMGFLDELQRQGAPIRVETMATSPKGRPVPLVIASRPLVSGPAEARRLGRPVVYVQANIHAGEVEGKEAVLHLLRRYALTSPGLLDRVVLLVVPIYNADGNEALGPQETNRPGQNGPAIVGQRANGQGLDLNRDYIKLDAPETRGAMEHVFTTWDPEVSLDLHATDGTRHGYPVTDLFPLNPNTPATLRAWNESTLVPLIRARVRKEAGFETFDYGNLETRGGQDGWYVVGPEGRYSTHYAGLRNRIGVLVEALVYLPFKERVRITEAYVDAVLQIVADRGPEVIEVVRAADREAAGTPGRDMGTRFEFASRGEEAVLLERPAAPGQPRRTGVPTDIEPRTLPIFDRFVPTRRSPLPAAYLVRGAHGPVADLLDRHGIVVERVSQGGPVQASTFQVTEATVAPQPFQGRRLVRLEGTWTEEAASAEPGDFLVTTAQPLSTLAHHILEPESLDGAVAWGILGLDFTAGSKVGVLRLTEGPALPRERYRRTIQSPQSY